MAELRVAQRAIGIIGAGIAGPVFALQMLSHPTLRSLYKVTLFDQGSDPYTLSDTERMQTAGAAVGMSPNGIYPLYQLGLKEDIEKISTEIVGVSTWRAAYGPDSKPFQRVKDTVPGPHKLISRAEYASWSEDLQTNMRAMERRQLRAVLLDRIKSLGGDISWGKRLHALEALPDGSIKALFDDHHERTLDLVVGADGGWSRVRQHIILQQNHSASTTAAAAARWAPPYSNASNVYGIATHAPLQPGRDDTHGILLPRGLLSTSPLPANHIRWDLMVPEPADAPPHDVPAPVSPAADEEEPWQAAIAPGPYPRARTAALLRRHAAVFHPSARTFGRLLARSTRIVHAPLRQRVWTRSEIQGGGNGVVVGDAARLMLPSSGSGAAFAVEDGSVLAAAILNNPPRGERGGFQEALGRYAAARVGRGEKMRARADVYAKVVLGARWWWRVVREGVVLLAAAAAAAGGQGCGTGARYVFFFPHLWGVLTVFAGPGRMSSSSRSISGWMCGWRRSDECPECGSLVFLYPDGKNCTCNSEAGETFVQRNPCKIHSKAPLTTEISKSRSASMDHVPRLLPAYYPSPPC